MNDTTRATLATIDQMIGQLYELRRRVVDLAWQESGYGAGHDCRCPVDSDGIPACKYGSGVSA